MILNILFVVFNVIRYKNQLILILITRQYLRIKRITNRFYNAGINIFIFCPNGGFAFHKKGLLIDKVLARILNV